MGTEGLAWPTGLPRYIQAIAPTTPAIPNMLKALDHVGYEFPSPVQEGVIPLALEGYDVMGQARTGTGKTAALLPLFPIF